MLQTPAFVFACSLCIIAFVGLTRFYDNAPPQTIGLTIAGGTLLILGLAKFNKRFRESVNSTTNEQLICWHSIRAPIGAAFLVLASEGLLPEVFAKRAGYGDLFTAVSGVLLVAICVSLVNQRLKASAFLVWNIVGIADLFLAVGAGIHLAFSIPGSMIWIARLPLLLVPTFILPVLFATHIIMLTRLVRSIRGNPQIAD